MQPARQAPQVTATDRAIQVSPPAPDIRVGRDYRPNLGVLGSLCAVEAREATSSRKWRDTEAAAGRWVTLTSGVWPGVMARKYPIQVPMAELPPLHVIITVTVEPARDRCRAAAARLGAGLD